MFLSRVSSCCTDPLSAYTSFLLSSSPPQAVEVVERDLLWDGPPIRLSNKGHLRLAAYLFKVRLSPTGGGADIDSITSWPTLLFHAQSLPECNRQGQAANLKKAPAQRQNCSPKGALLSLVLCK